MEIMWRDIFAFVFMFKWTKKDVTFVWSHDYQDPFDLLKGALVKAPILVMPYFIKPFPLDVDWLTCNVGVILSQR
jgi:hypothetical protein